MDGGGGGGEGGGKVEGSVVQSQNGRVVVVIAVATEYVVKLEVWWKTDLANDRREPEGSNLQRRLPANAEVSRLGRP
jgi:hypothetical protein